MPTPGFPTAREFRQWHTVTAETKLESLPTRAMIRTRRQQHESGTPVHMEHVLGKGWFMRLETGEVGWLVQYRYTL